MPPGSAIPRQSDAANAEAPAEPRLASPLAYETVQPQAARGITTLLGWATVFYGVLSVPPSLLRVVLTLFHFGFIGPRRGLTLWSIALLSGCAMTLGGVLLIQRRRAAVPWVLCACAGSMIIETIRSNLLFLVIRLPPLAILYFVPYAVRDFVYPAALIALMCSGNFRRSLTEGR